MAKTQNSSSTTSSGISGTTLLGILFVGLKLTNYIDWSWWWVTAPFWGPLAIIGAGLLVIGIVYLFVLIAESALS